MVEQMKAGYKTKVDSGRPFPQDAFKLAVNVCKQAFDDQIEGDFDIRVISKDGNFRREINFSNSRIEGANKRNADTIADTIERSMAGGGDDKIGVKFIVKM